MAFSHFMAGSMVLLSFLLLYQDRLPPLINICATQALILSAAIVWQAKTQMESGLLVTALIAFVFKAIVIPLLLHKLVRSLRIHRTVETVVGIGPTMLAGMGLVALSMILMIRAGSNIDLIAREDMAFSLSIILLGLLLMVTRHNAASQVVGFMSIENGLVLAATGAKGMPFVVETSVGFSILIAFIVIGVFLFRIRERFDTVDLEMIERFRGERS